MATWLSDWKKLTLLNSHGVMTLRLMFFLAALLLHDASAANLNKDDASVKQFVSLVSSLILIGYDDQLDPALSKIIFNKNQANLDNNAFIYALAFGHLKNDVYQSGLKLFKALELQSEIMKSDITANISDVMKDYPTQHVGDRDKLLCDIYQADCFNDFIEFKKINLLMLKSRSLFIDRYLELINLQVFQLVQTNQLDSYIPYFTFKTISNSQRLFHIRWLISDFSKDKITLALNNENRNLRRLLASADSIQIKLTLTQLLNENIEFTSMMQQKGLVDLQPKTRHQFGIYPLNQSELSFEKAINLHYEIATKELYQITHNENHAVVLGVNHLSLLNRFLMNYFYQPNMTINAIFQTQIAPYFEYSKLSFLQQLNTEASVPLQTQQDSIRNPMGTRVADTLTLFNIPPDKFIHHTLNINNKIQLLTGLIDEGSANAVINQAKSGNTAYLNSIDQSLPFIQDNKLCYSGVDDRSSPYSCLLLFN